MDDFDEDNVFDSDNALDFIMSESVENQGNVQKGKGCLSLLVVILVPAFIVVAVPTLHFLL